MNAVVIGGAGFVGSHLVDRLLADGCTVDVVDDLSTGALANLSAARGTHGSLRITTLDAASAALADLVAIRQPDVVYHLAAVIPGDQPPSSLATAALATTLSVLEAVRATPGAKVVVMLQAAALYGEIPARELPVKEGRGWAPADVRGVVSRAVLDLLQVYRDVWSVEFTALLAPCVYGPRQRPDGGVVAAFAEAARRGTPPTVLGDGRQVRDLLFIDDAVDALARSARRADGLVVNIGTGVGTQIRDLWSAVRDASTADEAPAQPMFVADHTGAASRLTLATTRARIHLDWQSWTDLAAGLADVMADAPAG